AASVAALEEHFGIMGPTFATPYGRGCRREDGPALAEAARESGVACLLTTDSELVRPGDDPFGWGRFTAAGADTAASLAAKLDGRYSKARHAWHWLKQRPAGGSCRAGNTTANMAADA
ncbi:MAG TPA: hypothetical protein VHY20_02145, partial [Pirellulales bacterium]|nr:hypothetical protein [Pirellulales bacterium]